MLIILRGLIELTILEIKNLTKFYGKFKALDDIDLSIEKGEIFGFIGPNGAGKSTTIKTMLNILKASSGHIKIFDKDIEENSIEIHKRIAYVPGDVNLWPNLSGGQVIELFLRLRHQKMNEKTFKLIKDFDLDIAKKCKSYSKGNRQKVVLIAALASEADFYIFDEPTSGLDPLMEQVFQEKIFELKKENKTVLLSSHILSEVEKLCDRIAIIKDGKIIETGTLNEMQHLTRMNVEITSEEDIVGLEELKGVYNVKKDRNKVSLQIDYEYYNDLIKLIAKYQVTSMQSMPPTLESLFLRYYGDDQNE